MNSTIHPVKINTQDVTPTSSVTDDFSGEFMHVLHKLYLGIHTRLEKVLSKESPLTFSQFLILAGFSCKDTILFTQAKLAEHLMLTEATISRHIQTLVSMGILTKEKDRVNKKSYNLAITPLGLTTYTHAKKIVMKELDASFSHISLVDKKIIMKNFSETITTLHQKK